MEGNSLNVQELRNAVDAPEEEAKAGRFTGVAIHLFGDSSTAEATFYKGSSSNKLLHKEIL
eukprot:14764841-Ditylum_brightwellii.AAC.1